MSFDHGTITCRVCRLPEDMPADAVEKFAQFAARPLEEVEDEPMWGWVSPRTLLDCTISENTIKIAGHYHICLRKAERKIPAALLNAECRMVELKRMAERDIDHLPNKERKAIKEEVRQQLLPQMPPQVTGMSCAIDVSEGVLYTSAISQRQLDIFLSYFSKSMGFEPIPLSPETAASVLFDIDANAVPGFVIAPDVQSTESSATIGQNFLTWLWQYQEERNGKLPPSKLGEFEMMIDGPLTFVSDGEGALEMTIKKGIPTMAAETKAALMVGKKLKRAKLIIARDREEWSCTFDADDFAFRSLKLPEGEALDSASIFQDRINNLYVFQSVFFGLYQKFLSEMTDNEKARQYVQKAQEWIKGREAK